MPHLQGLLDLKDTKKDKIVRLFQLAQNLENEKGKPRALDGSAILLFLEPSTRTRVSFEIACQREGLHPVVIQGKGVTSLEKDESLADTFLNLAALGPAVIVVRAGDEYKIDSLPENFSVPVINAGWGVQGHPTQALLDAYALKKIWGDVGGKKLLILGDVLHSRVAQSHFELATILGYEVRVFAPPEFLPKNSHVRVETNLAEALSKADAVMALRTQKERHQEGEFSGVGFNEKWGLNSSSLKNLKKDAVIMHPGPVNWGTELSPEIQSHPRSIILRQVAGGVFVRQALLRMCREGEWR